MEGGHYKSLEKGKKGSWGSNDPSKLNFAVIRNIACKL